MLYIRCYLLLVKRVFKYLKNTREHLFLIEPEDTNFDLDLSLKILTIQILACWLSTSIVYNNIPILPTICIYINLLKIMFYFYIAISFIIFDFLEMNNAVICSLALKSTKDKKCWLLILSLYEGILCVMEHFVNTYLKTRLTRSKE